MTDSLQLKTLTIVGLLLATSLPEAHAQHGHLNAGALGPTSNDKLYFANGDIFAASSGYVKTLNYANSGVYSGYYEGNITLTALPQTIANGGPAAGAAALGSFINVRLESVTGPAGGTFSMWEEGATAPTISLAVGSASHSALLPLSDASLGAGSIGADPYGHLHGRRFTTDLPGEYTVSFRLIDSSFNGAGATPLHAASDPFAIKFQAIPEPSTLALTGLGIAGICWATTRGKKRG